jgi:hypothetical protein
LSIAHAVGLATRLGMARHLYAAAFVASAGLLVRNESRAGPINDGVRPTIKNRIRRGKSVGLGGFDSWFGAQSSSRTPDSILQREQL